MAERVMDLASSLEFEYIGHRVVHGGELFRDVTEMTRENLSKLRQISSNDCKVATHTAELLVSALAPLHNPVQAEVIQTSIARLPPYMLPLKGRINISVEIS